MADAGAIAAIYNDAVATSTATFDLEPETVATRELWLAAESTLLCLVAELEGRVVAWSALLRWSERHGYDHAAEAAIYVAAGCRRSGVGRALVTAALAAAPGLDLHAVIAQICSENTPGLALATGLGFAPVGTLHEVGLKFGRRLDVTICERLIQAAAPQRHRNTRGPAIMLPE